MGISHRSGNYVRRVFLGKRTIKAGESCVIWSRNGVARQITGPKLVYMYSSTIRFLDLRSATAKQYLAVTYLDGTVEHVQGPASLYENPVIHRHIVVWDAIELPSETDALVATNQTSSSSSSKSASASASASASGTLGGGGKGKLDKTTAQEEAHKGNYTIVHGPKLHFPEPGEIIHEFQWNANVKLSPGTKEGSSANNGNCNGNGNNNAAAAEYVRQLQLQQSRQQNTSEQSARGVMQSQHFENQSKCTFTVASLRPSSFTMTLPMQTIDGTEFYVDALVKFQATDLQALVNGTSNLLGDLKSAMAVCVAKCARTIHSDELLHRPKAQSTMHTGESNEGLGLENMEERTRGATRSPGNDEPQQYYEKSMETQLSRALEAVCAQCGVKLHSTTVLRFRVQASVAQHMAKLQEEFDEALQKQRLADEELKHASRRQKKQDELNMANTDGTLQAEQRKRKVRDDAAIDFLERLKHTGVNLDTYFLALTGPHLQSKQPSQRPEVFQTVSESQMLTS